MRRTLIAILAIIYFTISSGVVMNIHYCMGKPMAAQLDILGAKTCGCGKSEEKKSCCKTELKVVKIEDVQKASYANFSISIPEVIIPQQDNLLQAALYHAPANISHAAHSPPLLSGQDTYLRNCVFRI